MHVDKLMTRDVIKITPDTTVADAAKRMTEKNVGSLVVCEGDQCKGILVDRAIVTEVIGRGKDPKTVKVHEVMAKNPTTIESSATVFEACNLIARHGPFRRLPVVDNGKLVGIISVADLAAAAECFTHAILSEVGASHRAAKVTHPEAHQEIERALTQ